MNKQVTTTLTTYTVLLRWMLHAEWERDRLYSRVQRLTRHITGHFGDDFTTSSVTALKDNR